MTNKPPNIPEVPDEELKDIPKLTLIYQLFMLVIVLTTIIGREVLLVLSVYAIVASMYPDMYQLPMRELLAASVICSLLGRFSDNQVKIFIAKLRERNQNKTQ